MNKPLVVANEGRREVLFRGGPYDGQSFAVYGPAQQVSVPEANAAFIYTILGQLNDDGDREWSADLAVVMRIDPTKPMQIWAGEKPKSAL